VNKLPTIERPKMETKKPTNGAAVHHVQPEVLAVVELELKSAAIDLPLLFGLDIGDPRRNIQMRLTRDQATVLRRIVDAIDQSENKPEHIKGRRANEQDWLRYFLDSVAKKLA